MIHKIQKKPNNIKNNTKHTFTKRRDMKGNQNYLIDEKKLNDIKNVK